MPNGWVHNLEHGGLVLLYSCDKGACDDASLQQLQAFYDGFPASPVCRPAPGTIGPVVAPFEQMPTKFAALVWDRVLYMDELDVAQIYDFFTRYAERVDSEGNWLGAARAAVQPAVPEPAARRSPSAGAEPVGRGEPRRGERRRRARPSSPAEPVGELTIADADLRLRGPVRRTRGSASLVDGRPADRRASSRSAGGLRDVDTHLGLGSTITGRRRLAAARSTRRRGGRSSARARR